MPVPMPFTVSCVPLMKASPFAELITASSVLSGTASSVQFEAIAKLPGPETEKSFVVVMTFSQFVLVGDEDEESAPSARERLAALGC